MISRSPGSEAQRPQMSSWFSHSEDPWDPKQITSHLISIPPPWPPIPKLHSQGKMDLGISVAIIIFLKNKSNVTSLLKAPQWSLKLPCKALVRPMKEFEGSVVWPFLSMWYHLSQLFIRVIISYPFPVYCTHLPALQALHHAVPFVEIPLLFLPLYTN